jgi:hypothetical protein
MMLPLALPCAGESKRSTPFMSRSRRKTPIIGLAASTSEKTDKVTAHRRVRHAVKTAVEAAAREGGRRPTRGARAPAFRSWTFAKDGKRWVGPRDRRLLRK